MSDKSSESSEEWLLLNVDDDPLMKDSKTEPLNFGINLNSSSLASKSVQYSKHLEELESSTDNLAQYIDLVSCDTSSEEEIEVCDHETAHIQKKDVSDDSASYADYEKDYNFNLSTVHKTRCYKHNPNHRVNFVLNVMLALAVSSAVSFGTGYFLGWSQKCWIDDMDFPSKETHEYALPSQAVIYEVVKSIEPDGNSAVSDKLINALELPVEIESTASSEITNTLNSEIVHSVANSIETVEDFLNDLELSVEMDNTSSETEDIPIRLSVNALSVGSSVSNADDVSDETDSTNSFNNSYQDTVPNFNVVPIRNYTSHMDTLSDEKVTMDLNVISDLHVISGTKADVAIKPSANVSSILDQDASYQSSEVDWSQVVAPMNYINKHFSDFADTVVTGDELKTNSNMEDFHKDSNHPLLAFRENEINKSKSNFTVQLRKDLIKVVQSLNAIAISQLSNDRVNLEQISKFYQDLITIIETKMGGIEDFAQSEKFRKYQKQSVKHLQKMIYGLIDFMDSIVEASLGTFGKDRQKANGHRLIKNLFKIEFNFDKRWERFQKKWDEVVDRVQNKELRQKHLQDSKTDFREESEQKSFRKFKVRSTKEFKDIPVQKQPKRWKRKILVEKPEGPNFKKYSIKS